MNGKTSHERKFLVLSVAMLLGVVQAGSAQDTEVDQTEEEERIPFVQRPAEPRETPRRFRRTDSFTSFTRARSTRRSRSGLARVPNMFGDDLGVAILRTQLESPPFAQPIPLGGAVRRMKIAENESAIPQDRWIFGYNFFNDPTGGFQDVNQFEVGLERTFHDGNSSLQIRVPIASTLASEQFAGQPSVNNTELGNLYFLLKTVLAETDDALLTGGFGFTVPTADDTRLFIPGGPQILEVDNDAFHLLPYLGLLSTRHEHFFFQSFVQLDIDTNGNSVSASITGANRSPIGVYQDPLVMYTDVGAGIWLLDDPNRRGITSMAALLELHYATTLQDADQVTGNGFTVASPTNRFDEVNLGAGLTVLWNEAVTVRPAMVVPLRTALDRSFDYEVVLQVNFWR